MPSKATAAPADAVPETAPAAPPPQLGQRCPSGHEYAQRSEVDDTGAQVFTVFCPACEPLAPRTILGTLEQRP